MKCAVIANRNDQGVVYLPEKYEDSPIFKSDSESMLDMGIDISQDFLKEKLPDIKRLEKIF